MQKVILLRYGEIFLKGRNRGSFESRLSDNIRRALKPYGVTLSRSQSRYFVEGYDEEDEPSIISTLKKVFGLYSLSPAVKVETDFDLLKRYCAEIADGRKSFRVTCKRADKRLSKNSSEIAAEIGEYVFENVKGIKVDLRNPECEITVDIRENGFTYVLSEKIKCAGGLPVGVSGNGLLLLSGGIDSPVAGYKTAQRGVKLSAVHFCSPPYTSELARQKVTDLAEILSLYNGPLKLYVVPFTDVQLAIHKNCKADFMITVMRRIMMRVAERLAQSVDCGAIITGESLGQVASQTMQSITVVNNALNYLPVFRPLIGMDKDEIVEIAQKINTFETSILPYEDCCTVFLPKNPVIKPKIEAVLREESKLDVEKLVEEAMAKIETIEIG